MGMGNHGVIYRLPWINIKVPLAAKYPAIGKLK
jgi:hypothetical protein